MRMKKMSAIYFILKRLMLNKGRKYAIFSAPPPRLRRAAPPLYAAVIASGKAQAMIVSICCSMRLRHEARSAKRAFWRSICLTLPLRQVTEKDFDGRWMIASIQGASVNACAVVSERR